MYIITQYKQGQRHSNLPGDYQTLDEAIEDAKLQITAFHRRPLQRIVIRRKYSKHIEWEWIKPP